MLIHSKPFCRILQVAGLLPISTTDGKAARSQKLTLYSLALLAAFTIMNVFRLWRIFVGVTSRLYEDLSTKVSVSMSVASTLIAVICYTVCSLNAVTSARRKIDLMGAIAQVDSTLGTSRKRKTRAASYGVMLSMLLAASYSNIFYFSEISLNTVAQFCKIAIACAAAEFAESTLAIRDRFRAVNLRLYEVVRGKHVWTTSPEITVAAISEAHWKLCCAVRELCSIHAPQTVSTIMYLFIHLVFNPYFFYLLCFRDGTGHALFLTAFFTASYIAQLYALATPCSLAVAEARKTSAVVAGLLAGGRRRDPSTALALMELANQLEHRSVKFEAAGLFALETPLVVTLVSAGTTYVAVIIQLASTPK